MNNFCAMRVVNPNRYSLSRLKFCGRELGESFKCPVHGEQNTDKRTYSQALKELIKE